MHPVPAVTMTVWPRGWVCQALRAPGSNVTRPPDAREGAFAGNRGSTRTEPVKFSAGPWRYGCEPLRVILIACAESEAAAGPSEVAEATRASNMTVAKTRFIPSSVPFQWIDGRA